MRRSTMCLSIMIVSFYKVSPENGNLDSWQGAELSPGFKLSQLQCSSDFLYYDNAHIMFDIFVLVLDHAAYNMFYP